ncbi:MAG: ATP-binding protein [Candidatus Saliniplasma sp.]
MGRERDMDILDMVKRAQLETLLELKEVESIEDNKQYLRAVKTIYLGIIDKAKFISSNPSYIDLDKKKKEVKDELEELEEKKKKSVEGRGPFVSDKFFERYCSNEVEEHIVKLLYSKMGVGLRVFEPTLKGEVLIIALKLITDTDPEEARKYLIDSSSLFEKDIIHMDKSSRRRRPGSHSRYGKKRTMLEHEHFLLNNWIIDKLHGHLELDQELDGDKGKDDFDIVEKLEPEVGFSEVVLPSEVKNTVSSYIEQSRNKSKFMDEWNLKTIAGDRKGVNILFSGESGTGKTMLSKAIANELGKDLYLVSYSNLVDCYHGNTESNVKRIFDVVSEDAVVLIDEADGILHRRSPARDSVDKSENRVVNIILQEMEKHSGLLIFTSNIAIGLDRAVERRLDLKLELPSPEVDARKKIWRYHIPEELPLGENLDIEELAEKYEFTGGQIKNVVLNAGRIAMRDGKEIVTREDFLDACDKEVQGSEAMNYLIGKEDKETGGYI